MAGAWLRRLFDRLGAARPAAEVRSAQAERVDAVWEGRRELGSASALFDALRGAVGRGPLDDAAVRRLAGHLRGGFGSEYASRGGHVEEHIALWRDLADRSANPAARGFLADCLLAAGRPTEAMAEFAAAFAADPGLLHEFGDELADAIRGIGGEAWLDYRLACLRAALAVGGDDDDADQVRELYGELCEEHRAEPASLDRIRAVGRQIEEAVARGDLPRALVRRGPRA
jgi:hypothetical protein